MSAITVLNDEPAPPPPAKGGRAQDRPYLAYALRRLVQAVVVIVLAYIITFLVLSVVGANPISEELNNPQAGLSPASVHKLQAYYGVNQSALEQLWLGLSRFFRGQFGISLQYHLPVSHLLITALPYTLKLAGMALLVSLLFAAGLAYGSQHFPIRAGRELMRSIPSVFLSVPNFVIGLILIQIFSFRLHAFDVLNPNNFVGTLCAAFALAIPISAPLCEVLIANLDKESAQEYVLVARSRGLSERKIFLRHLITPSSLPAVTMAALIVGELMGGRTHHRRGVRPDRRGLGHVPGGLDWGHAHAPGGGGARGGGVCARQPHRRPGRPAAGSTRGAVRAALGGRSRPRPRPRLSGRRQAGDPGVSFVVVPQRPGRVSISTRRILGGVPPTVIVSFAIVAIVILWALFPSLFTSHSPCCGCCPTGPRSSARRSRSTART